MNTINNPKISPAMKLSLFRLRAGMREDTTGQHIFNLEIQARASLTAS